MVTSSDCSEGFPKLSILMPTHNRADVLGIAIESVLNQSYTDFELLIVGDGCTDETAWVVSQFEDDRIIWMDLPKAPNFGYANRNIALKEAKGQYIGFAAHDDILLPDHFARCIKVLDEEQDVDLVYTRPLWVMDDGFIFPIEFNLHEALTREPFLQMKHNALPASCVVHRRSCFKTVGYWNEEMARCGDWDMWIRIINGGMDENYRFLRDPTCLHFVANWKNKPLTSGLREAMHWRKLYESTKTIPPVLMQHISDGKSPQEEIGNSIKRNPGLWMRDMRAGVTQVFDLRIRTFESETARLRSQLMEARELSEKLSHELDVLNASYSLRWGRKITKLISLLMGWLPFVRKRIG